MKHNRSQYRSLINISLLALICLLYVSTAHPRAQTVMGRWYTGPVYRGGAQGKAAVQCAVTWDAAALPELLDQLAEENVRITFCVPGQWAQENPELFLRMVEQGHEICTMGMQPDQDGDAQWVNQDISRSLDVMEELASVRPKLYYSGGRKLPASTEAASQLGLTHVLCTVDLLSARGDALAVLERALDGAFDGSIILMEPTKAAVTALIPILERLKQMEMEVVPTGTLLGVAGT